jgi:uncharacterized protein
MINAIKSGYHHKKAENVFKAASVSLLLCMSFLQPALAEDKVLYRTITVTGRGVESIPTTISQVNLGVEVQGKTAEEVQKEAARRSNAVVSLLKSRNVVKLETTGISLNPVYSYNNNVQKVTGYAANNTVSFRISTDKTGTVLDEAVKAGASQINGVSFVASDEAIAVAQKQALRKATQEAQQQAEAVLSTLGLKSKEVVSIQVNGANAPTPIVRAFANADNFNTAAKQSLPPTAVVGGEQQVDASVTLQVSY